MLSVERNYILVKCHLLGGPSERIIPPRTLVEVNIYCCSMYHVESVDLKAIAFHHN